MRNARVIAAAIIGSGLSGGCGDRAAPRPQLIVYVDTDAPTVEQAAANPLLSGEAAIDAVRVDALDVAGDVIGSETFAARATADWPLSFGVPADVAGSTVRLRLRAFRSDLAAVGTEPGSLEPAVATSLDRLVEIELPTDDIQAVHVVLASACRGTPIRLLEPATTCVADPSTPSSPLDGIDVVDARPSSIVGSWQRAAEVRCRGAPLDDAICIPGGLSLLGDAAAVGLGRDNPLLSSAVPARPVIVSAFWLDRTEMTVGSYREMVRDGALGAGTEPLAQDPDAFTRRHCTWLGEETRDNDALPLNCVLHDTARAVCEARGGRLPTEAEWSHAARGRGEGRMFPWGEADPSCCAASFGRRADPEQLALCNVGGLEPAGTHAPADGCDGVGDISRDGVLDLAGSVGEFMADDIDDLSGPCWSPAGILENPVCTNGLGSPSTRGGFWNGSIELLRTSLRRGGVPDYSTGFRCAYDDAPR